MNVTQLRELLQEFEESGQGDTEVVFAYNYGDHWRTEVAATINTADESTITYSEYHRMDKVVSNDDEEFDKGPNPKHRTAIVLA